MKQLLLKSGVVAAFSALAALPMGAQAAQDFGAEASALECKAGASAHTRIEWGLPTQDCATLHTGVMGATRSMDQDAARAQAMRDSGQRTAQYYDPPSP